MSEDHVVTPSEMRDLYKIPYRILWGLLLFSVLFHAAFLLFTARIKLPSFAKKQESIPVELVMPRTLVAPDTLQETAKEKPKDAKFESSRNLDSKENVSPEQSLSNVADRAGPRNKDKSQSASKQKSESTKIMTFTQDDMLKSGEIKKETLSGSGGVNNSPGFMEKLKRGEQLKIAAAESDLGQYITRMTRKISQQWSPRRVISSKMYTLDQVRTVLGIVLDKKGQILELRLINSSSFAAFDEESRRAVQDASPFPNPPKSLFQEDGLVYIPWGFILNMRQGGFYYTE